MDVATGSLANLIDDGLTRQPEPDTTDIRHRSGWRLEESAAVTSRGTILSLMAASGGHAPPFRTVAGRGLAVNRGSWAPDGDPNLLTIDAPGRDVPHTDH